MRKGEFNFLAFTQGSVTVTGYLFVMNKNVFSIRTFDETITFDIVKPFYTTLHLLDGDFTLDTKQQLTRIKLSMQ